MTPEVNVTFVLLREGTSDDGLIPHLQQMLVRAGADSAVGTSRPYKGSVEVKLRQLLTEDVVPDVVFVHWDSDSRDARDRRDRILAAATTISPPPHCVPVVPVQELEAWLLVDEAQIRAAVGRPSATDPISLPSLQHIEATAGPKEVLREALLDASGASGARRRRERRLFGQRRRVLLERLDLDGPVQALPSFQQLLQDVDEGLAALRSAVAA